MAFFKKTNGYSASIAEQALSNESAEIGRASCRERV